VVALLGLVVTACSTQAGAERDVATIAVLRALPSGTGEVPLLDELRVAGFVPGRSLEVLAADADEAYPEPADAEAAVRGWVVAGADLIVAMSTAGAVAAHAAAPDVNVLFLSNDPMATGLVNDERRPEGRLTGATYRVPSDRTLTLLQRLIPDVAVIGLPYPADDPAAAAHRDAVAAAAQQLDLELLTEEFTDDSDVTAAVDRLAQQGAEVLMLSSSPTAIRAFPPTQAAVERHGLPAIANSNAADFALLSLYPDSDELQRQMGRQAARLLSGSSPSAVPVEDPRRFVVRVNAGVAAALDITITAEVQREADEVVD
jgi:putative tryptophan/tyrosine transport system substrate-binding protein